jgi:hypothetical protein
MNPLDDQLDRLLRAATGAPDAVTASLTPPFGLEARVLAAWRGAAAGGIWNTALLVRGLALASVIMVLCLWPALHQTSTPEADEVQLADATVQSANL